MRRWDTLHFAMVRVIAPPGLVRYGHRHLVDQIRIPCTGESNGHGKHCEFTWADDAMKRLVPVVIFPNAEPRYCRFRLAEERYLFVESQSGNQIVYAHIDR